MRTANTRCIPATTTAITAARRFCAARKLTDSNGQVTFTTVYPGRYAGRATHIHVEVYSSSTFKTLLKTSQFAFVESVNDTVYATSDYSDSEEHHRDHQRAATTSSATATTTSC
jgi:protocatechuate 3,4-dioxygenase beta subunit